MENFYTSLEEAKAELLKRRSDLTLRKKVEEFLHNDIPKPISDVPMLVAWRAIMTPDNESARLLEYSLKSNLDFHVFEHLEDKFAAQNLDKYSLAVLYINNGKRGNGTDNIYKVKVADLDQVNGKSFGSISTLWGRNLAEFHHDLLYRIFPQFKGKVSDLSEWVERHGKRAKFYYDDFLALLIYHCILVENFEFEGEEGEFTRNIFYPAFIKNKERFGLKPLIVKLAPDNFESLPSWWYYNKDVRPIIDEHIKQLKEKHV